MTIYIIAAAIVLVGCASTPNKNENTPPTHEPIMIGFLGALTGPVAPVGEPARNAVAMAFEVPRRSA